MPVKIGRGQAPVLIDDVAKVDDAAQIQYNKVLINGQPSVYIPVLRQVGANTISVVDGVKELLPKALRSSCRYEVEDDLRSVHLRAAGGP